MFREVVLTWRANTRLTIIKRIVCIVKLVQVLEYFTYCRCNDTDASTYTLQMMDKIGIVSDGSFLWQCHQIHRIVLQGRNWQVHIILLESNLVCWITSLRLVAQRLKVKLIPCPPVLNIDLLDCDAYTKDNSNCNQTTFDNKLTWTDAAGANCDKDIA